MCHFHWKWGQSVLFCFCKSWLYSLLYTACHQPVTLTLCSVTTRSVQPCVATTVSYITGRRKCCLLPLPSLSPATLDMIFCSGNRCHTSPFPLPPADRTSITSRHCEKRAQKATPIKKRRVKWWGGGGVRRALGLLLGGLREGTGQCLKCYMCKVWGVFTHQFLSVQDVIFGFLLTFSSVIMW